MPKAFDFAESFSKLPSSNPLHLLDDRYLDVAPRAFENRQEAISPVLKSGRYVGRRETILFWKVGSTAPTTFENRTVAISPVLKSFSKFKCFWRLNATNNLIIHYEIEGNVLKNYKYLPNFLLTKAFQTIPIKPFLISWSQSL